MSEFALVFGDPESIERARKRAQKPEKTAVMYRTYGHGPDGAICRDCVHLVARQFVKTYYKCALFGDTRGPGTDWRVRTPACGKFERETR